MATVIPAFDKYAGLRIGLQNLAQGYSTGLQRQDLLSQQKRSGQQLAQLFPNLNLQGITDPRMQAIAAQLGIAQAGQNEPFTLTPGAERFGAGGQRIAGTPIAPQGFSLGPGQQRFDPTGQPIAQVPATITTGQIQAETIGRIQRKPADQRTKEESDILRVARGLPTTTGEELTKTQISKNRAEAEAKLRAGKGILTPEQKISQTNVFRKEFDVLSKDFRVVRDSFERINASAADPSPAGDLALIFNFMKILDPGSVVRESEFANAAATGAWGERLKAAGLMILEGVRLSPKMRADFLNRGERLFKAQQSTQNKLISRYTKLSGRFGLNPQDVITETDIVVGKEPQGQQQIGLTPAQQKRREELRKKAGIQ